MTGPWGLPSHSGDEKMRNLSRSFQYLSAIILPVVSAAALSQSTESMNVPRDMAMGLKHHSYDFSSIEDSSPEMAMDYTQVKAPLGKFDVLDHVFVPTLSLERTGFRFNNVDVNDQELYTLKTQLMFIKKQDDRWTRIIQVTPSLHTDMDAVDEDAFSLMGLAIWRYQSTDHSAWTMGIGANRLFGEYKPIPLLSYQYQVSDQLQFDLGFPITKAEYRWQQNWSGFASVAPVGGNWRYETETDDKLNVSYSSWVASTGIRYQFKSKLWATLELGQGFARKLDLDADSNLQAEVDVDNSPAIMFSIGFHP